MKGTIFLISYSLNTYFPRNDGLTILIESQSVFKAFDLALAIETNVLSFY